MIRGRGQVVRQCLATAVLGSLLLLGSCGYKDKPVPPTGLIPRPIVDLSAQLDDQGATLQWSAPAQTVSGEPVSTIDSFLLYRYQVREQDYCRTCPIPFDTPQTLPGGGWSAEGPRTSSYQAGALQPGYRYVFKVRSKIGWWIESQDSNLVTFLWQTPPLAPEGLRALGGDGKNTLKWQPVTHRRDATPLTDPLTYQLYRRVDGNDPAKLGGPTAASGFTDRAVENGRSYGYQVQALTTSAEGTVIGGPLSAMVTVQPLDRTAPAPPGDVQGLRTEVGVKIFWTQVEGADLGGYRVYRRAGGEKLQLVGEVALPYTLYIDRTAPAQGPLFYAVASIDTQVPANESPRSSEVQVDP